MKCLTRRIWGRLFFVIFTMTIVMQGRVFQSPAINDWLFYSGTVEYLLDYYFYNRRSNFCWDIGLSYVNRYADTALNCRSSAVGTNLSYLFHGSSDFVLTDFQPQPDNVLNGQNGVYEFLPSYVLNETSCNINLQVSKDFEYKPDKYIHSTIRCIVPFDKQSISNISSGNMYANTTVNTVVKRKKGLAREEFVARQKKLRNKENGVVNKYKYKIDIENNFKFTKNSGSAIEGIVSPYIKVSNGELGQTYFAIQGSYFNTYNGELFNYMTDIVNDSYIAYNKNAAPGHYLDNMGNNLSLDELCHSYSLANMSGEIPLYIQLIGASDGKVYDTNNISYEVQNTSYNTSGLNSGAALVSFYTYGSSNIINNGFYVNNACGISYPITLSPSYISDVQVGDLVSSTNIVYGDGLTGQISSVNLPSNTLIRMVATGPYGDNPYLNSEWMRDAVEFDIPPILVQRSFDQFPVDFGVAVNPQQLTQNYNNAQNGSQFDFYGDYLINNSMNNNPRLTVLNADGTFYDPTAQAAILWYQTDYTNLFYNPSDAGILSNLKNLYITTALNSNSRLVTDVSRMIAERVDTAPDPEPSCCQKLHDWVAGCVAPIIITSMNENTANLQSQIWSLMEVNNSILGNVSPIATVENQALYASTDTSQNPFCQLYSAAPGSIAVDQGTCRSNEIENRLLDNNCSSFKNGQFGFMQYNGFNQSGLGDILLEFLGGSYFLDNTLLVDVYVALECPTAKGINESDSYLAVGIGNNGHYVGRIGLQGFFDIDRFKHRFRFSSKMYLEHGFSSMEKIVPQFNDYPVFGLNPVKMDTMVDWNGGLFYLDGSFYVNDYSGVTCSYQYWNKGQDNIWMIHPMTLAVPNVSFEVAEVEPTYEGIKAISNRVAHTVGMSVFSRIANELFCNCGMSWVCAGRNVPQSLDMFWSVGVSY